MADKDSKANDAGLLRGWRKRLGLTQAAAAERLGLHVASLKNIEGGKRNVGRAVRILMDTFEPGSAKAAPKRTRATQVPDPAPIAAPNPMDAELVEVGRRYAKVGAAFVSAALVGGLTADLIAEMAAARKEVHRMQALGGSPFSETAMSVFGAFILSSNAAQRALQVALEAGVEEIAQAVDMRNFTLSDVSPTLLAGGQGISLNSVHGVLLGRQPRQGSGGTPEKTEPPAFPDGLTLNSADAGLIALTLTWTALYARLVRDVHDGKGDALADTVETLRERIVRVRKTFPGDYGDIARLAFETAFGATNVIYRLKTELDQAKDALAEAKRASSVATDGAKGAART
jgi:hypothetical protein